MAWTRPPEFSLEFEPRLAWSSHRFGYTQDDLVGQLWQRFNVTNITLQDIDAFRIDVDEASSEARDISDFHERLDQRRAQRTIEAIDAWNKLLSTRDIWRLDAEAASSLARLAKSRALSDVVRFLEAVLKPKNIPESPARSPTQSPSLYIGGSEGGVTQDPHDDRGIGPEHDSQWKWAADETIVTEGMILQHQGSSSTSEQTYAVEDHSLLREQGALSQQRESHARGLTRAKLSNRKPGGNRKRSHNHENAEDVVISGHKTERLGKRRTKPVEEPDSRQQGSEKTATATTTRSRRHFLTVTSSQPQQQESLTASAAARPVLRTNEPEGSKKRKREQDNVETQPQPDHQLTSRRVRLKRIPLATAGPRRSARIASLGVGLLREAMDLPR